MKRSPVDKTRKWLARYLDLTRAAVPTQEDAEQWARDLLLAQHNLRSLLPFTTACLIDSASRTYTLDEQLRTAEEKREELDERMLHMFDQIYERAIPIPTAECVIVDDDGDTVNEAHCAGAPPFGDGATSAYPTATVPSRRSNVATARMATEPRLRIKGERRQARCKDFSAAAAARSSRVTLAPVVIE
jgi:hypothetical protein